MRTATLIRHAGRGLLGLAAAWCTIAAMSAQPAAAMTTDLDRGWGTDGEWAHEYGNVGVGVGYNRATVAADGRVYVVGLDVHQVGQQVFRLTESGELDQTFYWDGSRPVHELGAAFALDGGRLIHTEQVEVNGSRAWLRLRRLAPDGRNDTSFGGNGIINIEIKPPPGLGGTGYHHTGGRAWRDGRWLFVLSNLNWDRPRIGVTKVSLDGRVDRSFGTNGTRIFDQRHSRGYMRALEHGWMWVAGSTAVPDTVGTRNVGIVERVLPDGSADTAFAGDGTAVLDLGDETWVAGVAPLATGGVLAAGHASHETRHGTRPFLARLTPDGVLDTSFGSSGVEWLGWPSDTAVVESLQRVPHGFQLVVGPGIDGSGTTRVERRNIDGSPMRSFGTDGRVFVPNHGRFHPQYVTAQEDGHGRLVVAYAIDGSPGWSIGARRFRTDTSDLGTDVVAWDLPAASPAPASGRAARTTRTPDAIFRVRGSTRGPWWGRGVVTSIRMPSAVIGVTATAPGQRCRNFRLPPYLIVRCVAPMLSPRAPRDITVRVNEVLVPTMYAVAVTASGRRDHRWWNNVDVVAFRNR